MRRYDSAGLGCAEWPGTGGPTVLALHGLTATSQVWNALARAVPQARIVAPDLPGRGDSVDSRAGLDQAGHAAAVLAVADELDLRDVVLIGHSLGAYVAPLVAEGLGDRLSRVVLLDGGVSPERHEILGPRLARAVGRLHMRRIDRRWRDADAFMARIERTALRNRSDLRPAVREWAEHLLAGPAGAVRPRFDSPRLAVDAVDIMIGPGQLGRLADLAAPVRLLAAAHGAHDDAAPVLSDRAIEHGRSILPRLVAERVDANHITLLFHPRVAETIR